MSTTTPSFRALLDRAITEPGVIHAGYSAFHDYSLGNQLLAAWQCAEREIPLGPIATFPGWKAKGRHVRKGEKALCLCQPVTMKRRAETSTEAGEATDDGATFTRFVYRNHWFVLAQTDGADLEPEPIPTWDRARALAALDISEVPFDLPDGNCQGYARQRTIAVSPIAILADKTRFHELAHVVLGHTAEAEQSDGEHTPRTIREVEAEATALLCLEALGLPGAEHCRGYIQHWNRSGEPIAETTAQRILKAADTILRAGRQADATETE